MTNALAKIIFLAQAAVTIGCGSNQMICVADKKTSDQKTVQSQYIINGVAVDPNSEIAKSTVKISAGCTGVIISEKFVLTAAHCAEMAKYGVKFGVDLDSPKTVYIETAKVTVHPEYRREDVQGHYGMTLNINDIAIVELKSKIPQNFKPISVDTDDATMGTTVLAAGYGRTDINDFSGATVSNKLLQTSEQAVVSEILYSLDGKVKVAKSNNTKAFASKGDSGGPNVTIGDGGGVNLLFLTSQIYLEYGDNAGPIVADYLEWIRSVTKAEIRTDKNAPWETADEINAKKQQVAATQTTQNKTALTTSVCK